MDRRTSPCMRALSYQGDMAVITLIGEWNKTTVYTNNGAPSRALSDFYAQVNTAVHARKKLCIDVRDARLTGDLAPLAYCITQAPITIVIGASNHLLEKVNSRLFARYFDFRDSVPRAP